MSAQEPGADPAQQARVALVGLILAAAAAGLGLYAAFVTRSLVGGAAALHLLLSAAVWGFVLLTTQGERRAALEALEQERLAALAAEGRQALFTPRGGAGAEGAGLERLRGAGHALLTLLGAAGAIGGAAYLAYRLPGDPVTPSLGVAASLGAAAFTLLLLGRYAFAIQGPSQPLLGAGARRSLSGAAWSLVACLSLAAQHKGLPQADLLGYLLLGLEALLGVEALLLLLLEAYRPRRAGEVSRPAFDSRLLGLLSAPSDVARSIARAVDYQFGFSLSETWLYQFTARWVLPLVVFAGGSFWLLSALIVVEPHQVVLLRRLGRLQAEPLGPGLHLKLPWPLDRTSAVEATRLHEVSTGEHLGEDHEGALLWTSREKELAARDHDGDERESLVLIPRAAASGQTPVNLITAAASVHYRIREVRGYAERSRDARRVLKALAERELSFLFGGEDFDELLQSRVRHQATLKARLQAAADRLELGVTIESALLTDLHPPLAVGKAFEEPSAARERAQAEVFRAHARETASREQGESQAEQILSAGRLDAAERLALAQADAARFEALRVLHAAAPRFFRTARLLDELAAGAKGKRKLVVGKEGALTELDLQEKVSAEELGLGQELSPPGGAAEEDK